MATLTLVTDLLTGANLAIPLIFAAIKAIRDQTDPAISDAQLIDLLNERFAANHQRAMTQIAELRGTV